MEKYVSSAEMQHMQEEEFECWANELQSVPTEKAPPCEEKTKDCTAIIYMHRPRDYVMMYLDFKRSIALQKLNMTKIGWEPPAFLSKAERSPEYTHKLIYYPLMAMDMILTRLLPPEERKEWRKAKLSEDAFEDVEVALMELSDLLIRVASGCEQEQGAGEVESKDGQVLHL
jgi:hypothetical protein